MPNKYDKFHDSSPKVKKYDVHPVWRGVGCLLMMIVPVMAYAGSVLLLEANARNGWMPVGSELLQTVAVPVLGAIPHLYANLILTVVLSLIGFSLLTVVFAVFTRIVAPPPPSFDAPPVRRSAHRRF